MTHRLNLALILLALLIGFPAYWLLIDNRADPGPPRHLEIAELRRLADSLPGEKPSGIEVEIVATASVPQTLFAAGSGFRMADVVAMAFRLPVDGGKAIMIDTGTTAENAKNTGFTRFYPRSQAKVDAALRDAALILLTHEHSDHMGGIEALAETSGLPAALRLNPAQARPLRQRGMRQWRGVAPAPTFGIGAPFAVAPGVVVIPAPDSHTPGSQMIYARFESGEEVLFAGDIATLSENIVQQRLPARLLSEHIAPSNRAVTASWLAALGDLQRAAPGLLILPGHDIEPLLVKRRRRPADFRF